MDYAGVWASSGGRHGTAATRGSQSIGAEDWSSWSNRQSTFSTTPQRASRGCRVAMVLGLYRTVGDCERCGRSLRGRPVIRCQRCGCRLCEASCVRLCHRAADGISGSLNELARGCAARFCAQCEPIHTCARAEPLKVLGWKRPPDPSPLPPLRAGAPSLGTISRCSSAPPGGGRVVPRSWAVDRVQ